MLSALEWAMGLPLVCCVSRCMRQRAEWNGSVRVVEMAGRDAARCDRLQCRSLHPAAREGVRTARVEMAAGGRIDRRGDLSLDRRIGLLGGGEGRDLGQ